MSAGAFEMSQSEKPLKSKLLSPGERKNTVDEDYSRRNTFSRAFTFDTGILKRTLTQTLGIDPESDEAWTKSIMETYKQAASKGVQGDMPEPAEFARDKEFWINMLCTGILSAILGFAALFYLNFTEKLPKTWANDFNMAKDETYFVCSDCSPPDCSCDKYHNMSYYEGKTYWIAITTVTGLLVGLIRFIIDYPDDMPGIFKEILSFHVDPKWAPATYIISAISLGGGACLGPEQAMGNLGGGMATYVSEHYLNFKDDDNNKLFVLGGMSSALGCLFPTPLLGVIMLHELGKPPKSYMESTLILSFGAIVSFLVYYAIVGYTFLETLSSKAALLSFQWNFSENNCFTAVVIGIVSAVLGIAILLFIGITKQILNRIRIRLARNRFLQVVFPSVLAGLSIGCVYWALPMTIGNGNMALSPIVHYGLEGKLSKNLLVASAFGKMFCLGVSMNGGFVGGMIFPIMTIGAMAGVVANILYPELPLGLCVGSFIAALPASICPMPFTLACLSIFIFYFGLYQTAPIFIASITSYTLLTGSGLFNAMRRRGEGKPAAAAESAKDLQRASEESFAVEQYLGAKKASA